MTMNEELPIGSVIGNVINLLHRMLATPLHELHSLSLSIDD